MATKIIFVLLFYLATGFCISWFCDNGDSIHIEWKCDGRVDCHDGSDELTAHCPSRLCKTNEFKCESGPCIPSSLQCNGEINCGIGGAEDFSDEENCELTEEFGCGSVEQFFCDNICIPRHWICDGTNDCKDYSDEENCDSSCLPDHFLCESDFFCYPNKWLCDGEKDCDKGEDEANCSINGAAESQSSLSCNISSFKCGDECFPVEKSCDGIVDCRNSQDEGTFCHLNRCRSRGDLINFNDTDEENACNHACRETPEGPKCLCMRNYRLQQDGFSCKPNVESSPTLYYSSDNEILSLSLKDFYEDIVYKQHKFKIAEISSLSFEKQTGSLLWSDHKSGSVEVIDAFYQKSTLAKVKGATGISLDWITRNVYVAYNPTLDKGDIGVASLLPHLRLKEVNFYPFGFDICNPVSIAVHPAKRIMIFADKGNKKIPSRLLKADMDGTHLEVIISEHKREMSSVVIDYTTDILYWSEVGQDDARIKMMQINGDITKILVASPDYKITNPTSISVFANTLYFCDNGTKEVWAINSISGKSTLYQGHRRPIVKMALAKRFLAIYITHPVKQHEKDNACRSSRCSYVCVLRPGGSTCLCPKSMHLAPDNATCLGKANLTSITQRATFPVSTKAAIFPDSNKNSKIYISGFPLNVVSNRITSTSSTTTTSEKSSYINLKPVYTGTYALSETSTTTNKKITSIYAIQTPTSTSISIKPHRTRTYTRTSASPTTSIYTKHISTSSDIEPFGTTPFIFSSPSTSTKIKSKAITTPKQTASIHKSVATKSASAFSITSTTTIKPVTKTSRVVSPNKITTDEIIMRMPTNKINKDISRKTEFDTISTTAASIATTASSSIFVYTSLPDIPAQTNTHIDKVLCRKPILYAGTKISQDSKFDLILGTKVTYYCFPGWFFKNYPTAKNITLTCVEGGVWDNKAPICSRHSCKSLNCKNGKCVKTRKGAACKCNNGNISNSCEFSNEEIILTKFDVTTVAAALRHHETNKSTIVVIVVLICLAVIVVSILVFRTFSRSPKYSLVDNEDSPFNSRKLDYKRSKIIESQSDDISNGIPNPSYSKVKMSDVQEKVELITNDDKDSGLDQSSSSPSPKESVGSYSYKFLANADQIEENFEQTKLDSSDIPQRNPMAGLRKSLLTAFNISKSESQENLHEVE